MKKNRLRFSPLILMMLLAILIASLVVGMKFGFKLSRKMHISIKPTSVLPEWTIQKMQPDMLYFFQDQLSPDQKWFLEQDFEKTFDLKKIISIEDGTEIDISKYRKLESNSVVRSWSPDGLSFTVNEGGPNCSKCPFGNIVIFNIDPNRKTLTSFTHKIKYTDEEASSWFPYTWSPDSENFAIAPNFNEVLILNKKAEVTGKIETGPVHEMIWVDNEKLVINVPGGSIDAPVYTIKIVDINNPELIKEHDFPVGRLDFFAFKGFVTDRSLLIIQHAVEGETISYSLINTESALVEQALKLEGVKSCSSWQMSADYLYAAFTCSDVNRDNVLYVYNIKAMYAQMVGVVEGLVSWNTKENGFVVISKDLQKGFEIVTIDEK